LKLPEFNTVGTNGVSTFSRVLLEMLTVSQPVMNFPAYYGAPKFINAFKRAQNLSLYQATSIQSTPPHHTSRTSILI
jgi:hypothetical protein